MDEKFRMKREFELKEGLYFVHRHDDTNVYGF